MTGPIADSLHFSAHLLALAVALGAAFVAAGDRDEGRFTRVLLAVGFLSIAAGEGLHGAAFAGEQADASVALRTAGFVLFAVAVLPRARPEQAAAGGAVPGMVLTPALAASAAALSMLWRRRHDPRFRAFAAGLAVLGAAEALLAARGEVEWAFEAYHALRAVGFLAVGWYALASTYRSIQFRIVAGFVSLLLAVVLGISAAVTHILARNLRQETFTRVQAQAVEANRRLDPLIGNKTSALLGISSSPTTVQRIRRNVGFPRSRIESFRRTVLEDVDFVLLLGRRGSILGRSGIGEARALEVVGTDVVGQAMRSGLPLASVTELGVRRLALVGVAPVESRGTPIGFAVAGFFVDDGLLDRIASAGSRVAIFRGGNRPALVAASGFPGRQRRGGLLSLQTRSRLWESFLLGGTPDDTVERSFSVNGARHFGSVVPVRQPDREPVGMLLVAEPAAVLAETQRDVSRVIFLVTLAVVSLVLLLSMVAARRITRPVRALTAAARRVQAGDLEAKAPVTGQDEVGNLGEAFNQMTSSISLMTSELREAATEQARLRNRLETVVNSMSDGLVAVDREGRIVTCNQAAGDILGRSTGEVVGELVQQVLRLRRDGEDVDISEEVHPGTAFIRRPDGSDVPVAVLSSPLQDADGAVLGRVYVVRDMTREYEVERMKTEFLSNVSHELRTPLTPIIGYSEILQRRSLPPVKTSEFAGGILAAARRLERIVAMLVDFSAMEGGRMTISAEPTAVGPLVDTAVDEWREKTDRHEFQIQLPTDTPLAMADIPLIRRTLDELLDNAVKYSPGGGRIMVTVGTLNSDRRPMVRVEVADQGIGIEPAELEGIFQDFRQVDASDTRTFGGLGLGLAFVKRIVEAHGGTITARSTPGEGTTFTFTLPAVDQL